MAPQSTCPPSPHVAPQSTCPPSPHVAPQSTCGPSPHVAPLYFVFGQDFSGKIFSGKIFSGKIFSGKIFRARFFGGQDLLFLLFYFFEKKVSFEKKSDFFSSLSRGRVASSNFGQRNFCDPTTRSWNFFHLLFLSKTDTRTDTRTDGHTDP